MHFGERYYGPQQYVRLLYIYHFVNVIMNHNNGIGLNILVFIIVKRR